MSTDPHTIPIAIPDDWGILHIDLHPWNASQPQKANPSADRITQPSQVLNMQKSRVSRAINPSFQVSSVHVLRTSFVDHGIYSPIAEIKAKRSTFQILCSAAVSQQVGSLIRYIWNMTGRSSVELFVLDVDIFDILQSSEHARDSYRTARGGLSVRELPAITANVKTHDHELMLSVLALRPYRQSSFADQGPNAVQLDSSTDD
ncbi:hypothetical protein EIP91_009412 [Steccherinum ochraceum]|uniref:Uncharacterized protein n=1 Tax=Steccherinum ochraceum TaxID=92696 RepID=A0A4V2MV97_9APHY|nr:hypothetical protein EIP91_009412 [Steccherinum ochraceum]